MSPYCDSINRIRSQQHESYLRRTHTDTQARTSMVDFFLLTQTSCNRRHASLISVLRRHSRVQSGGFSLPLSFPVLLTCKRQNPQTCSQRHAKNKKIKKLPVLVLTWQSAIIIHNSSYFQKSRMCFVTVYQKMMVTYRHK